MPSNVSLTPHSFRRPGRITSGILGSVDIGGGARARITVDTSDFDRAVFNIANATSKMEQSFNNLNKRTTTNTATAARSFDTLSGSIFKAGAALMGLQGGINILANLARHTFELADAIKVAEVAFAGYLGSVEAAAAFTKQIRDFSRENRMPVGLSITSAQQLLPGILASGGTAGQTPMALDLARRLSVLNPNRRTGGGIEGAILAVTEMLQGQMRSLNQRFANLGDPVTQASAQTGGDRLRALDIVLNDLGITSEVATQAMNTWELTVLRLTDSVALLLSTALTPLLNRFVIPAIDLITNLLYGVDSLNTPLLGFVGSVLALAAAGNGIMAVGQHLAALPGILTAIGTRAQGLVAAAAVVAAAQGTIALARNVPGNELSGMTQEEATSRVWLRFKQVILLAANLLAKAGLILFATGDTLGDAVLRFVNKFKEKIGLALIDLGKHIPGDDIAEQLGRALLTDAQRTLRDLGEQENIAEGIFKRWQEGLETVNPVLLDFAETLGLLAEQATRTQSLQMLGNVPVAPDFTDEQIEMWQQYQTEIEQLTTAHHARMEEMEAEYQTRVQNKIADFNLERERLVEDFERDQADKERELARRIDDIRDDINKTEAAATIEHQKRIVELETDFNTDQQQRLVDHQLKMQRLEEDHREALADAAGRLDALAFIREIQNFNRQKSRANEDFNNEQRMRQQQFEKRIDQEIAHHEQSLDEQRQAADQKIKELQAQYRREAEQARAEFDLKMARRQQDFNIEMQRMADEHAVRMNAEAQQFANQMAQLDASFRDRFLATQTHLNSVNELFKQKQREAYNGLLSWWNAIVDTLSNPTATNRPYDDPRHEDDGGAGGGYAVGGNVPFTGRYLLHAGERILSPAATRRAQDPPMRNIALNMPINITGVQNADELVSKLDIVVQTKLIQLLQGFK